MADRTVTALADVSSTGLLYAAVKNDVIYRSPDRGATWQPLDVNSVWVNEITPHPRDPATLFALTQDRGVLKTVDGGTSWVEINEGLSDHWATTLTFHPNDSDIIYVGTYAYGIFKSDNGGQSWMSVIKAPLESPAERERRLSATRDAQTRESAPAPPEAFWKCNDCHGWADATLDSFPRPTYHRAAANQRDWSGVVKRMRHRAQLAPTEEKDLIDYLNTYYGIEK